VLAIVILIVFFVFAVSAFVFIRRFVFILRTSDKTKYKENGDGTIHAYFINLDRSKDRLAHIVHKLKQLRIDFTRIPAVCGNGISDTELKKLRDENACKRYVSHAVGRVQTSVILSHAKIWKTFLESDNSYALIFEDDADFNPRRLRNVVELLMKIPKSWDVVDFDFLFIHHLQHESFSMLSRLGNSRNFVAKINVPFVLCSCYLINRKAAIKYVKKALPVKIPIDHYCLRPWEFGIKLRTVVPQLACQKFEFQFKSEVNKVENRVFNPPAYSLLLFWKVNDFMMRYFSR
jgi:glycosyl transferase family 25